MMKQFETIDISGDAGIRAFGRNLQELFSNAAAGMYSLVTELSGVAETGRIEVSAQGESVEGLLVAWLNELIFRLDAHGFVGKKVAISALSATGISATLYGEEFDPARHEQKLLVKAATYHRLSVSQKDDHWEAEVIFDI